MKRFFLGLLKVVAAAVLLAAVALYAVANYSASTQELTCKGHWKDKEGAEVAHVQLTDYRWWVHLWGGNSDGNIKLQTENLALSGYHGFVRKIGEGSLALYDFSETKDGDMRGGYRVANAEIVNKFAEGLVFIGTCGPRAK